MKKMLLVSLFILSSFASAHCPVAFTEVNLCTNLSWPKGVYADQKNLLNFFFWTNGDKTHTPVTPDYKLKVYSWMTMEDGHDHFGPKFNLLQLTDASYEVNNAYFMGGMEGSWSVVIELQDKTTGAVISKASVKVPLNDNGASAGGHNHAH